MKGKLWTDEEQRYVRENYLRMKDIDIAKYLGRTELAVMSYRKFTLGLKKPRGWYRKVNLRKVQEMINEEKSINEIAEHFGVKTTAIYGELRRHKIEPPRSKNLSMISERKGFKLFEDYCKQHGLQFSKLSHHQPADYHVNSYGVNVKNSEFGGSWILYESNLNRLSVGDELWLFSYQSLFKVKLIAKEQSISS